MNVDLINKKFEARTISYHRILYKKLKARKIVQLTPKFNKQGIYFYFDREEAQLIWQFVRQNQYYINLWSSYVDSDDTSEKAEFKRMICEKFLLEEPTSPTILLPKLVFKYSPIHRATPENPGYELNKMLSLDLAITAIKLLGVSFIKFNKLSKGFHQFNLIEYLIKYSAAHSLKEELGKIPNDKYMAWAINEKIFNLQAYKRINSSQLNSFKLSFKKISAKSPFIFFC